MWEKLLSLFDNYDLRGGRAETFIATGPVDPAKNGKAVIFELLQQVLGHDANKN